MRVLPKPNTDSVALDRSPDSHSRQRGACLCPSLGLFSLWHCSPRNEPGTCGRWCICQAETQDPFAVWEWCRMVAPVSIKCMYEALQAARNIAAFRLYVMHFRYASQQPTWSWTCEDSDLWKGKKAEWMQKEHFRNCLYHIYCISEYLKSWCFGCKSMIRHPQLNKWMNKCLYFILTTK